MTEHEGLIQAERLILREFRHLDAELDPGTPGKDRIEATGRCRQARLCDAIGQRD